MSNLEITDEGRIRVIAINRPDRRNAVDGATARELFDAFNAFDKDDASDIAILTGKDGAFCAGADLKALSDGDGSNPLEEGGINSIAPMGIDSKKCPKDLLEAARGVWDHALAMGE